MAATKNIHLLSGFHPIPRARAQCGAQVNGGGFLGTPGAEIAALSHWQQEEALKKALGKQALGPEPRKRRRTKTQPTPAPTEPIQPLEQWLINREPDAEARALILNAVRSDVEKLLDTAEREGVLEWEGFEVLKGWG